jgi:death on curing protein
MERVTMPQIEYIIFSIAKEKLSFNEPIPDFSTRYPNILESCLSVPFQTFNGKDLYSTFITKISILFYLMIKNHPFQNGNKRLAMVTLFYVLYKNNKWLKVSTEILYNFAVWVAESIPDAKDEVLQYIEKFLKKYMVPSKNEPSQ